MSQPLNCSSVLNVVENNNLFDKYQINYFFKWIGKKSYLQQRPLLDHLKSSYTDINYSSYELNNSAFIFENVYDEGWCSLPK